MSPLAGGWVPVEEPDLGSLLRDLNGQLRYPLPEGTVISRTRLACYPAHVLLRFGIPGPLGLRESFAFHAPGQLYPLDGTRDVLNSFNSGGLEVETADHAVEALRFYLWATIPPFTRGPRNEAIYRGSERTYLVERWADLPLDEEAPPPDDDSREAALALLGPPVVPPGEEERRGFFRLEAAVGGAGGVRRVLFEVSSSGVEDLGPLGSTVALPLRSWPWGSEGGVVLVREVSFDAQRFLRWISAGRPLHRARVTEPVVARGRSFTAPVSLSQVVFEHDVDFGGAVFEQGLELDRCELQGRLTLREAEVKGTLDASGLRFTTGPGGRVRTPPGESLFVARGLRVTGSLHLNGLRCPRPVSLEHAVVDGDLRMGGCELGAPRTPSLEVEGATILDLEGIRVGGDLDLVRAPRNHQLPVDVPARDLESVIPGISTPSSLVRGGVDARRIEVGGEALVGGLRCDGSLDFENAVLHAGLTGNATGRNVRLIVLGHVYLEGSHLEGSLLLGGMWVGGKLGLSNARVDTAIFVRTSKRGSERIRPAVVRGGVILSGIRTGDVEFEGSQLGHVSVATGSVGRLFFQAGLDEVEALGGGGTVVVPCRAASVWLGDITVDKGLGFVGLHVAGRGEVDRGTNTGFVRLSNVRSGGDLTLGRETPPVYSDPPPDSAWLGGSPPPFVAHRTRLEGHLDIDGYRGEGGASLGNVKCAGRVRFRNSSVEGAIEAGPVPSGVGEEWPAGWGDPEGSLECTMLDLEMTQCGGDADLSGIRVAGEGPDSCVRARSLVVKGRLLFSRPRGAWEDVDHISQDPGDRHDAVVQGRVDLSVAEASHLVISGSSFQSQDARVGIVLERGRFRRLHVIEPWPFSHDLSDVQVERWQIPTEHLLTFLDRSHPFRRSTYIEIERVLRNEAQDAEADRVYRGMRRRAIREGVAARKEPGGPRGSAIGHLARTNGSRILGVIYGWGTLYWLPMLFVALPTFVFSWGLFSQPQNVEATPVALVSRGIQARQGVQPPELGFRWGSADGLWMALRYHVPVVPLSARGIWEPSNGQASLRLQDRDVPLPFSGEGYAFAIFLLHWIIWPLFLYGIGRKVIRDRA